MEYYSLENYFSFTCLAGACPSTCCSGWSILVDEQDYQRFCRLEQQELREDILLHMKRKDGKIFFQNQEDGRCAMLDEDGLCRIQKNSTEETLCNTCRKYPRLLSEKQGVYYFSMAASCPVISKALWLGKLSYIHGGDSGRTYRMPGREIPLSQPVWAYFDAQRKKIAAYRKRVIREELFWDSLGYLFELVAELLPELPKWERTPWEEILLFYSSASEEQAAQQIEDFLRYDVDKWETFIWTYLDYRFFSRQAVKQEIPEETFCQTMGEVFMVQAFCFLEFWQQGDLSEENICEWIQRMYRFCAHGKKSASKVQLMFWEFYQEKSLWNYLLLGE